MQILLVDDDKSFCDMAEYHLTMNPNNKLKVVHTGKAFEKMLTRDFDVVCIDHFLPDTSGDKLLRFVKEKFPEIDIIIISGQEDINMAIELLRKGAFDYVTKDENAFKKLWSVINNITERQSLKSEVKTLKKKLAQVTIRDSKMIGDCDAIKQVHKLMGKAAGSHINVLVNGETGTGKELVAQTIHSNSDRKKKSFVPINVTAIPADLMESELFGHKKGAFTGANADRTGKFEEANGGTIFLDEIGEMELTMQAKILRVLQESEVVPVGGNKPKKLDFRLIVATHKNLREEVRKGTFREDLYYRLMGLKIELPPLRERGADIILLANHFISSFANKYGNPAKKLTKEARKKLMLHAFPGNVRELKSVMDLAMVLSDEAEIDTDSIQLETPVLPAMEQLLVDEEKTMKEYELFILKHYLERHNFNVVKVANILGIGRSSIYRLIKENNIK